MKVTYTTVNGMSVELDGDDQKSIFKNLGAFQEVFDETTCAKCGSTHVRFITRMVEDNEYFEIRCLDCGATLSFGQTKKGNRLFPKRKDKEGNWLPDRGWVKWNAKTGENE